MTDATQTQAPEAARELVLERVIDAPRALVYQAFTTPAHLNHWFGPKGFTITTKAIDVRPGGSWDFVMHGPDGKDWPNFVRYLELEPNARLLYDHGESADGPAHFRVTVTFEDEGVRTRMRMRSLFPTVEGCEAAKGFGAVELGYTTLEKLAARVDTMGLRLTRTVDAPRDLVYQAWTEPARLAKWWGPTGFDLEVLKLELRPGGVFHYRMSNGQGAEMWGKFVYQEVEAPARIVYVSSFSDAAGGTAPAPFPGMEHFPLEVYNVLTLTEVDGKTVMEMGGGPLAATEEQRAFYHGMRASMEQGFGGTFKQLDAYLAEVRGA